jgi:hypothetical protein
VEWNGSAPQGRGQGQHPKAFGLPVHQRADITGLLACGRSISVGSITSAFFVEGVLGASVDHCLAEALETFVAGSCMAWHWLQSHLARRRAAVLR